MKKTIEIIGKTLGKGVIFGLGIAVSFYTILAWQSSTFLTGTNELKATSGESLTLDKWNELISRVRGINTDTTGVVNLGGDLKFADGTTQTTAAAGGGIASIQSFTGSGTWTKPTGINKVKVIVLGGGGGGGGYTTNNPGGGGGAAGYCEEIIDVTSISSISVTVGLGGSVSDASTLGGSGGSSSFGSYCLSTGGSGGDNSSVGEGGSGSNGDININGGRGKPGYSNSKGGAGADGPWGGGGNEAWHVYSGITRVATAGTSPGAGGGGGNSYSDISGAGASGIVIVYEYK